MVTSNSIAAQTGYLEEVPPHPGNPDAGAAAAVTSPVPAVLSLYDHLASAVGGRTLEILESRRRAALMKRRGWLVRRMLLLADVVGLSLAFVLTEYVLGYPVLNLGSYELMFALSIPGWIVLAKLHELYDQDEDRAEHSSLDELRGVFRLITTGTWLSLAVAWLTGVVTTDFEPFLLFWAFALLLVAVGRGAARTIFQRKLSYLQNTVIVGAGDVGQLIARKLLQHPEYGINLVGFVDSDPKEQRTDLTSLTVLGTSEQLPGIVRSFDVERVIVAFSNEPEPQMVELIRSLRDLNVHIDLVPRLYELVGPKVAVHDVEGMPLFGLPPVRLSRSSRFVKRALDIFIAGTALILTSPLFAYAAWRIKRDSQGPVFFRQTRLGLNMREFTALKFRTMLVDADDSVHREYIKQTMSSSAVAGSAGLYKLERTDVITRSGQWLRRTSLDELPQLLNVLRGEMSIVGPRPCIPYETENFRPHHFERFLVPAGLTGLWQVKARAHSTFGEALDLDVAYAHGWSLRLDCELICRTPLTLLRNRKATA